MCQQKHIVSVVTSAHGGKSAYPPYLSIAVAPPVSRIVRESIFEETLKAIRDREVGFDGTGNDIHGKAVA